METYYTAIAGDCHMLMGKCQNSLDAKFRMIIPAKYRDELGFHCVLAKGLDKCLYIYPIAEWEKLLEKISALPTTDEDSRRFVRSITASAVDCEIDKQGRVTIPQDHRYYAGIGKELVTVGVLDKLEIWSRAEWENAANGTQVAPGELAQKMVEYGI